MKTIKVIEGKAFMCEELAVNPNASRADFMSWYNLQDCIEAVRLRMVRCMGQLEEAIERNTIYAIDAWGVSHSKGKFVVPSYEAMETLMTKLKEKAKTDHVVDITWIEDNLVWMEIDQLFKAYVAVTDHFGCLEMRLLDAVVTSPNKGVGDPKKTVLRITPKPE